MTESQSSILRQFELRGAELPTAGGRAVVRSLCEYLASLPPQKARPARLYISLEHHRKLSTALKKLSESIDVPAHVPLTLSGIPLFVSVADPNEALTPET